MVQKSNHIIPKNDAELATVPAAAYPIAPIKGSKCQILEPKHQVLQQFPGKLMLLNA